ncbi:YecA family protein [Alloiococcus sp. CFN-8]|uniref:YecA family protein n=1 Tax=Alloiococcus sp. CFN-8 TaxID=3416081 RepID=UPI003CF70F33
MKPNYTLKEILDGHSADDVKVIGKAIGIKSYSKMKKENLINAIVEFMLDEKNLNMRFLVADDIDIEIFEEALEGKEKIENPYIYRYWMEAFFIFFTVEGNADIPIEIKNHYLNLKNFKSYQESKERLSIINSYALACTNLYSVIDVNKLVEIINSQTTLDVEAEEVIHWCITRENYGKSNMYFYENGYVMDESFGYNASMDGQDYEIMLKAQEGKPYYIPDKEELLRYVDRSYIEENESFKNMLNYVRKKLNMSSSEAYDYCADIQIDIRCGSTPSEILNMYIGTETSFNNRKEVDIFLQYLKEMFNNTRIPENRGYTPDEVVSLNFRKDKADNESNITSVPIGNTGSSKIPRNSPCPCGSGKKYKNCCGRN